MLKNWTVKTKQIKKKTRIKKDGKVVKTINSSAFKYGCYLLNKKAQSHYNTNIIDLNNAPQRLAQINSQITSRKLHRQGAGLRGGGINCEATSFVLSIPKDIKQPTAQEWKRIAIEAIKSLEEPTGIAAKEIWKQSVVILHEETSASDNTHLNIMIGNIYSNNYCKELTQKRSTYAIKNAFNNAMLRLGIDHREYSPKNDKVGDKPLHIARKEKIIKLEKNLKKEFKKIKESKDTNKILILEIRNYIKLIKKTLSRRLSLKEREEIDETIKSIATISPKISQIIDYSDSIKNFNSTTPPPNPSHKKKRKRRRRIN
ncbi:MAG: hypothetical protein ACRBB6_11925 [Neptuniibacter sp.]